MPIDNLSKITSRSGINTTILLEAGNANVTGIVTAAGFDGPFTGGSGSDINSGIVTAAVGLHVGVGGTILYALSEDDGKVGIGTAVPDTPLHIYANDSQLLTVERSASANSSIRFRNTIASMYAGLMTDAAGFAIDSDDNLGVSPMFMVKQSNGNVGIGTAVPNAKLNIYSSDPGVITPDADADELVLENGGNVGLSLLTAGTGESSIYFGNPGTNGQKDAWIKYYHETHAITGNRRALTFKAGGGTEKMRLTSGSILGVGITTPNQESGNGIHIGGVGNNGQPRLHLTTAYSGHTTTDGFYIVGLGNESSGSEGNVLFQNKENADIMFSTNNLERLRIQSGGNVQIGSAADPGDTLRYVDIANFNTGASAGSILRLITTESDGTDTSSADIVKYKAGGLIINNSEKIGTAGYISFGTATAGGSVKERLRIHSDGRVGINTTGLVGITSTKLAIQSTFTPGSGTATGIRVGNNMGALSVYPANLEIRTTGVSHYNAIRTDAGDGNGGFTCGVDNYNGFLNLTTGGSNVVKVQLHTNGVSYFKGGNVGIGTSTTLGAKVDIFKNYSGIGVGNTAFRVYGTDGGVAETGVCFVEKGEGSLHADPHAYLMRGISNSFTRFVFKADGKVGIGTTTLFSKFQVGSHTFSGGNGMYTDTRVGMSNHGELTGLMLASTYNDAAHPEYGLVFVQGPNTSSYNVWSISPDGPAKGNNLNFHYDDQGTNIHSPGLRKVFITGIGTISPHNNGTQDLGQPGNRWRNLYTSDLDLSNEAKGGNDVDGTWGSYRIQEGESDLFLINKRSGKKYKFNLTEVE